MKKNQRLKTTSYMGRRTDEHTDKGNGKENDMGVYIPNEDMPKDCYTCFCYETEFNMCSLTGKRLDDIRIRQDDCPLIEIVTCGECKHYGFKETDRGGFPCCTNVIGATPYRMPTRRRR